MRISDGSSDVCSSDLPANMPELGRHRGAGLVNAIQHPAPAPERGLATKVGNEIDGARIRPVNTDTLGNDETDIAFGAAPVISRHIFRWQTVRRSEEHTSELQSLMRISYAVFCLKKKKHNTTSNNTNNYTKNQ